MAGKRTATSDLNHDNWDREEEPEESGSFKKASDDILKSRTIRTAKRRNPIHKVVENESEEKPNIFGGVNFTKSSSTTTQAPDKLFGFLSNLTSSSTTPKTNGTSDNQSIFNKDAMNTNRNESKCTTTPNFTPTSSCSSSTGKTDNLENYYAKLKGLNQSVAKWINKHVDSNPLINLQPIFKDYEHFFTEIEKEKKNTLPTVSAILENKTDTNEVFAFKPATNIPGNTNQNVPSTSSSIFKFSSGESIFNKSSKIEPPPTPATQVIGKLSFGVPTISTPSLTTSEDVPKFSFGSSNVATSGFQFSANNTPFSFSNVSKPTTEVKSDTNKEGEESDEPPKVEVKEVEEKGQIYSIRCKVFVKKEGHFVERGVGNLFLKPVADSSKVQLIVRAYTNLGKLLCNFILSESIPLKRMGKNNVMLICVPTPEDNPPPTPVLLRVKSSEEADELLQTLEKHKN